MEGADRDGAAYLRPCLSSHWPLDWVVIVLGTNDLKHRFGATAGQIAAGAEVLIDIVRSFIGEGREPEILLVAPAPLGKLSGMKRLFEGGTETSRSLAAEYRKVAQAAGVHFLDAGGIYRTPDDDGVHMNAEEQRALGEEVASLIRHA